MIISRTPLRMSFVGGGSDLPVFYRRFGGAVVSTAINQFVYVTVNKKFDQRIRLSYSRTEDASSVARIRHPLVRESMKMLGIEGGVEITSIADVPSKGTGLEVISTPPSMPSIFMDSRTRGWRMRATEEASSVRE